MDYELELGNLPTKPPRSFKASLNAIAQAVTAKVDPNAATCHGDWPPLSYHAGGHRVRNPIDWSRVKQMLASCTPSAHRHCGPLKATNPFPPGFRVIDVKEERLASLPAGRAHVALSYVWGGATMAGVETRLASVQGLEKQIPFDAVPRVIRDAMTACQNLGQRYLWVDRLCIVQDDQDTKPAQIAAMGLIYRSAAFVIIAVQGKSGASPLPGVSFCRLSGKQEYDYDVHKFPPTQSRSSTWWTRGWTYQEAVLARRKLYVDEYQVWLECDSELQSEKTRESFPTVYDHQSTKLRDMTYSSWDETIKDYDRHVAGFNHLQLSFPSDIFNAFAGISEELFADAGGCHCGLPRSHFDEALLWAVHTANHPVKDEEPAPSWRVVPDMVLPTWSWVSVTNCLQRHLQRYQYLAPLTIWFEAEVSPENGSQTGKTRNLDAYRAPLWWQRWSRVRLDLQGGQKEKPAKDRSYHLTLFLAIRDGLFGAAKITKLLGLEDLEANQDFGSMWAEATRRYPTFYDFYPALRSGHVTFDLEGLTLRTHVILAEVQLARFRIGAPKQRQRSLGTSWRAGRAIFDHDKDAVGVLHGDLPGDVAAKHQRTFDFIGLSLSVDEEGKEVLREDLFYADSEGQKLRANPVVNVMMVEFRGSLARRLGIGWIHMKKWAAAERQTKVIALE